MRSTIAFVWIVCILVLLNQFKWLFLSYNNNKNNNNYYYYDEGNDALPTIISEPASSSSYSYSYSSSYNKTTTKTSKTTNNNNNNNKEQKTTIMPPTTTTDRHSFCQKLKQYSHHNNENKNNNENNGDDSFTNLFHHFKPIVFNHTLELLYSIFSTNDDDDGSTTTTTINNNNNNNNNTIYHDLYELSHRFWYPDRIRQSTLNPLSLHDAIRLLDIIEARLEHYQQQQQQQQQHKNHGNHHHHDDDPTRTNTTSSSRSSSSSSPPPPPPLRIMVFGGSIVLGHGAAYHTKWNRKRHTNKNDTHARWSSQWESLLNHVLFDNIIIKNDDDDDNNNNNNDQHTKSNPVVVEVTNMANGGMSTGISTLPLKYRLFPPNYPPPQGPDMIVASFGYNDMSMLLAKHQNPVLYHMDTSHQYMYLLEDTQRFIRAALGSDDTAFVSSSSSCHSQQQQHTTTATTTTTPAVLLLDDSFMIPSIPIRQNLLHSRVITEATTWYNIWGISWTKAFLHISYANHHMMHSEEAAAAAALSSRGNHDVNQIMMTNDTNTTTIITNATTTIRTSKTKKDPRKIFDNNDAADADDMFWPLWGGKLKTSHPNILFHTGMAWLLFYQVLETLMYACSATTTITTDTASGAVNTESTTTRQRRRSRVKDYQTTLSSSFPELDPRFIPPIDQSMTIQEIGVRWKNASDTYSHAISKHCSEQQHLYNHSSSSSSSFFVCVYAWIANRVTSIQSKEDVKRIVESVLLTNRGWAEEGYLIRKPRPGWVAMKSKAVFEIRINGTKTPSSSPTTTTTLTPVPHVGIAIGRMTIIYMKSYGPKWKDSKLRITMKVRRNVNNTFVSKSQLELDGYQYNNTNTSMNYEASVPLQVKTDEYVVVKFQVYDGTTFRINGMLFCRN